MNQNNEHFNKDYRKINDICKDNKYGGSRTLAISKFFVRDIYKKFNGFKDKEISIFGKTPRKSKKYLINGVELEVEI
jgi:hypothetical protein